MVEKFFTDEELVAYLDGESDFAPVADIEYALKSDQSLAKRLEQLDIDRESIFESFQQIQPEKSLDPMYLQTAANQNRPTPWRLVASVAVLCLGIGFSMNSVLTKSGQPDWTEYVAAYQALYTSSTLTPVNQDQEALTAELTRVSAAIGKDISPEQLQISEEVEYKRAQVLGFDGTALIQLAFLTSMGEPMALCILRTGAEDSDVPSVGKMEGMSSALWSNGGYSYLLIGGKDDALISRLANEYMTARL